MRHPPRYTKTDILRAVKAVLAAGVGIARVEIEPGKITIITSGSSNSEKKADLDTWLAEDARQT